MTSIDPILQEVADMDEEQLLPVEAVSGPPSDNDAGLTETGMGPESLPNPGDDSAADVNELAGAAASQIEPSTDDYEDEAAPVAADQVDAVDEANPAEADNVAPEVIPAPKFSMEKAIAYIREEFELTYKTDGTEYAVDRSTGNPQVYRIDSAGFASAVRRLIYLKQPTWILTADPLREIQVQLQAMAELLGREVQVWRRVAQHRYGVEIDRNDDEHTRFLVTPGKVEIITEGSDTLFLRDPSYLPFPYPADEGDISKMLDYLNVDEDLKWLLIAWMAYTLAHPKVATTNYPILVLRGDRGSGKSTMCNVILGSLVGPTTLGVQAFPGRQSDLAIVAQTHHVGMFDNVRKLTPSQQDQLCRAATGATTSTRKLYTDGEAFTQCLHFSMVLNGIHPFVDQDDMAQRCLTLNLKSLSETDRQTEYRLKEQFQLDLPVIFRGVLDLIADIFMHLPTVTAKYPERMLEFSLWLAAMEKALGKPEGELQMAYRENLVGAMRNVLEDDPLADAVLQLAQKHRSAQWEGQPLELYNQLSALAPAEIVSTMDWPKNAISLSLRLKKLRPKLSGAGVEVTVGKRGKLRQITVKHTGRSS